jgi:hypothetical protein
MSRDYKEMPPLWYLQQQFQLSDQYPSGLEWRVKRAGYQIGDAVGCKNRTNNLYTVYVWGEKYLAHRIVWYLRTGQCPDGHAVEHDDSNPGKDNRLGLRVSYVANKKRTLLVREARAASLTETKTETVPTTSTQVFKYVHNIDELNKSQLESHGYYRGYPCVHGHYIRHRQEHWCFHCIMKIQTNICGFDLNYLHINYKERYRKLWNTIDVGAPEDCWNIHLPGKVGPKRQCFPSYRSLNATQRIANVNVHKLIYQCAWGDVGSTTVTRTCGNVWCGNPLHMASSWNRGLPPEYVQPFEREYQAEKLMLIARAKFENREQEVIRREYKSTITHPLEAKEPPYYDEG